MFTRVFPIVMFLFACGATPGPTANEPTSVGTASTAVQADLPAASVSYYQGTSTTTSPDGSTPYGPVAIVIVRRRVDPAAQRIEEHVINDGQAFPTTLRQTLGAEFSASDESESFSGTVSFSGPDWAWTRWAYDLSMSDGSGTLRGQGTLSVEGIRTEKMFYGPDGSPQALIIEELSPIDEATYQELLSQTTTTDD